MIFGRIDQPEYEKAWVPGLARAFDIMKETDFAALADGRYEVDGQRMYYTIQQGLTKPEKEVRAEAHAASGASGGAVLRNLGNAVGDFVSLAVDVPQAGTYGVSVRSRTAANRAQLQLSIDGVDQGPVFDSYSATIGYQEYNLGTVTFASAGTKVFKFLATGKNPNSTGYGIFPDPITLIPQ